MKKLTWLVLCLSVCISSLASAHDGRHWGYYHWYYGFYDPFLYGPLLYPPYPYNYPYYPPSAVAVNPQPPVYVQQPAAPVAPQAQTAPSENFWYHCSKPEGYYPYVKECPKGWQKVSPTPMTP
jgi:hypothetical protein